MEMIGGHKTTFSCLVWGVEAVEAPGYDEGRPELAEEVLGCWVYKSRAAWKMIGGIRSL